MCRRLDLPQSAIVFGFASNYKDVIFFGEMWPFVEVLLDTTLLETRSWTVIFARFRLEWTSGGFPVV